MSRLGFIVCWAAWLVGARAYAQNPLPQPNAPSAQQVVYLKNGRAVHGVLLERNHSAAVLRLQSREERVIPNEQIAYIGRLGSGGLHIEALEPGNVSIDRVPMGHTPLDLSDLDPGDHLVQIAYDAGESSSAHAAVYAGATGSLTLPAAKLREVGRLREGVKLVSGGGFYFGVSLGEQRLMGGAGLAGGLNLGLSPRSDFRWLGHVQLGSADSHLWFELGTSASLRLNLSSVYAMELGVRLALMPAPIPAANGGYDAPVKPTFGAQGSLLSLRLGANRCEELSLWHALQWSPATDTPAFQSGISLMHVWL